MVQGAIFSIHPQYQPLKNAVGVEEKSGEQILKEIRDKGSIENVLSDKPSFVKAVASELSTQVGLVEANTLANHIVNTITNPKRKDDLPADMKQAGVETALTMLIPSIMGARGHVQSQGPLNDAAMFELGSNPDKYTDLISKQLAAGKLTPDQAQKSQEAIQQMKGIIDATPTSSPVTNQPLTPDQVKAYANNLLQKSIIQKKIDAITEQQGALGGKDEAQIKPLTEQIAALNKARTDIMDNAGVGKPIPKPEPPAEEPAEPPAEGKEDIDNDVIQSVLKHLGLKDESEATGEDKDILDDVKKDPKAFIDKAVKLHSENLALEHLY